MSSALSIAEDLRRHLTLCQEILGLVEREKQTLRDSPREIHAPGSSSEPGGSISRGAAGGLEFATYQAKRNLLPSLTESLNQIRQHRLAWQKWGPSERAQYPEVPGLLRQNQDVIMKIIVLDRENEQGLLRKGLMPARQLPHANRQRAHHVADLYRRAQRVPSPGS